MRLLLRLSVIATAAALAPTRSAPPRPVSRTPNRPPSTMSQTQKSNKSKLQTIVKDKIEEDTAVKEELNIEEPWRGPGARTRARVSDARSPGHTPTHAI